MPAAEAPAEQSAPPAETAASAHAAPQLSPERITERVAVLDAVAELPLAEHVELYQRLHAELQSALAEIDGP
jgi:DNA-binding GntR family transcriptional regulator